MKTLKKIGSVLSVIIIAVEAVLILAIVLSKASDTPPNVFGHNLCVVVTPSMEPDLKVGDLIISKIYRDGDRLERGDIVTYRGSKGELSGKLITHQVIDITYDLNGSATVITKGTANKSADPPIDSAAILSVMKYKTLLLGPLYRIINTVPGFLILVEIPMLLLIADGVVGLVKAVRKEGKELEKEDQND